MCFKSMMWELNKVDLKNLVELYLMNGSWYTCGDGKNSNNKTSCSSGKWDYHSYSPLHPLLLFLSLLFLEVEVARRQGAHCWITSQKRLARESTHRKTLHWENGSHQKETSFITNRSTAPCFCTHFLLSKASPCMWAPDLVHSNLFKGLPSIYFPFPLSETLISSSLLNHSHLLNQCHIHDVALLIGQK